MKLLDAFRPSTKDRSEPQGDMLPRGDSNENPSDIGFLELLAEDFRTYDANPLEPGFWAVATHRFGNWRMGIKSKAFRAPFSLMYKLGHTSINWFWGIDLGYN